MSPAPAKAKAKPRATGAAAAAAKGPSRLGGGGSSAAAAAGRGGSSAPAVSPGPKAAFGRTISSPSPVVERKKAAAVKRKPKSARARRGAGRWGCARGDGSGSLLLAQRLQHCTLLQLLNVHLGM